MFIKRIDCQRMFHRIGRNPDVIGRDRSAYLSQLFDNGRIVLGGGDVMGQDRDPWRVKERV